MPTMNGLKNLVERQSAEYPIYKSERSFVRRMAVGRWSMAVNVVVDEVPVTVVVRVSPFRLWLPVRHFG